MTATDKLRRLLDERGAEWRAWDSVHPITVWHDEQCVYEYMERTLLDGVKPYTGEVVDGTGRLEAVIHVCSPEQAVEATLGRGTCRVDVLNTGDCAGYECSEYIMHCNGCGHEFGHVLYNEDGDVWMSEPPRFCPNCGRKVVEE